MEGYLSENADEGKHKFIVIIYYAGHNARVDRITVNADCYADAVIKVAPGNDAYKVEVIAA